MMRTTVAAAQLRYPKLHTRGLSVREARTILADDHVHALLVVDGGILYAVVERADLVGRHESEHAEDAGRLDGRTVSPGDDLEVVRAAMTACRRRRLAVVDTSGALLGLLCLKRHGQGFCSDADIAARREERSDIKVGSRPCGPRTRSATTP